MSEIVYRPDGSVRIATHGDPAAHGMQVVGWDRHTVGLDLGRHDPSALVVLRDRCLPELVPGRGWEQRLGKRERVCVHMETVQLDDFNDLAQWVIGRLELIPNWKLIIDASGLGKPFSDILLQAGVEHWAAVITAGSAVTKKGRTVWVAKNTLIEGMASGLETGDLQIAHDLPTRAQLEKEIASFQLATTSAGNTVLQGGGKGHHADAAIAFALAYLETEELKGGGFFVSRARGLY